ncbi:MAG: AAC(3) family N-acetyltransferase [Lentisphaerae bacterium]|nr:AAC(3) family N-acetyltransferase [Lentisphaerota bacterium]
MKYDIDKLVHDLQVLGVKKGDTLLVHSGFRTINAENPLQVIEALEQAIGSEGTLVMPSFPGGSEFMLAQAGTVVDIRNRKSDCGVITETFRKLPGVKRSLSPGHCMAARGRKAAEILAGHEKCCVSAGKGSPFEKIIDLHGKILLIGTGNDHNTTLHYVENTHGAPTVCAIWFYPSVIDENGRQILVPTFPHMPGMPRDYTKVDPILTGAGLQINGKVGDAEARLIDAYQMNELIGGMIEKDHTFLIKKFDPDARIRSVLPTE